MQKSLIAVLFIAIFSFNLNAKTVTQKEAIEKMQKVLSSLIEDVEKLKKEKVSSSKINNTSSKEEIELDAKIMKYLKEKQ